MTNARAGGAVATTEAAPDEAALRDHALRYLARFAATETGVRRVLLRRVDRWARRNGADPPSVAAAKQAARLVAAGLTATGLIDDAAYAAARARSLARRGRSRRAIAADLAGRGAGRDVVAEALDGSNDQQAAAAFARRRRLGPFAAAAPDPETRRRALAAFARAGFASETARTALAMTRSEAEALLRDAG